MKKYDGRFSIGKGFLVLLKEFIGRVQRDSEDKYDIFSYRVSKIPQYVYV